jgi:hypothetical protein
MDGWKMLGTNLLQSRLLCGLIFLCLLCLSAKCLCSKLSGGNTASKWIYESDGGGRTFSWNKVSVGVLDMRRSIDWSVLTFHVAHA